MIPLNSDGSVNSKNSGSDDSEDIYTREASDESEVSDSRSNSSGNVSV